MPDYKIELPQSAPSDAPLVTVQYNDEWTPIIVGALDILTYGHTFTGDDRDGDGLISQLIELFALAE